MGVSVTRCGGRLHIPPRGCSSLAALHPGWPVPPPQPSSQQGPWCTLLPLYRLQAPSPLSDAWSKTEHLIFPLLHLSNLCRFLSGTLPLASVSLSLTQLPPALSDPPRSQCSCPCLRRTLPGSALGDFCCQLPPTSASTHGF